MRKLSVTFLVTQLTSQSDKATWHKKQITAQQNTLIDINLMDMVMFKFERQLPRHCGRKKCTRQNGCVSLLIFIYLHVLISFSFQNHSEKFQKSSKYVIFDWSKTARELTVPKTMATCIYLTTIHYAWWTLFLTEL